MRACLVLAFAFASTACLRSTAYQCASDEQCVGDVQGTCEGVGYCSFPDTTCESGSRFPDGAGPHAQKCVGETTGPDAGVSDAADDGSVDAPIDGPSAGCPASYAAINGSAHRYRLITAQGAWATQRTACANSGGYLVVPDDATELMAISTLSPNNLF